MSKKEIILICILGIVAVVRFFFFIPKAPDLDLAVGKNVEVKGIITDYPDHRLKGERLILLPYNQKTKFLIVASYGSDASYGDEVKVRGVLETPENFITNAGKEFNYKRYLDNKDIYYIVKNADVEIVSTGHGNKIQSILFKIRDIFSEKIDEVISSPKSDLGRGLILGDKGGFDTETNNNFIKTGTIHIVALSGYNITIVSGAVIKTFSIFLSSSLSMIFGIIFIFIFILLVGGGATIVRAGIMAFIALYARLTGRTYFAGRALVIAGLLMITYDPRVITDMSFQLSFIVTAGILYLTPKIIKWVSFAPMRFSIRENLATTIGATIAVLPLLLYETGVFSLVSLPANILILPVIPIAMFFTFLSGLLGIISPIIALPFGFIADQLLSYILFVINTLGDLSFASINITSFPIILTILFYILIIWWIVRKNNMD